MFALNYLLKMLMMSSNMPHLEELKAENIYYLISSLNCCYCSVLECRDLKV